MGLRGNQCSDCKQIKSRSQFYKNKSRASGLSYICKACQRKRTDAWSKGNPDKVKANKARYRSSHRERLAAQRLSLYWSNPEVFRSASNAGRAKRRAAGNDSERWNLIRRNYNLSKDQWLAIFQKQGSRCGACRSKTPNARHGWHTDHDHVTGKIRGILCPRCNQICDSDTVQGIKRLLAALKYLKGSL